MRIQDEKNTTETQRTQRTAEENALHDSPCSSVFSVPPWLIKEMIDI